MRSAGLLRGALFGSDRLSVQMKALLGRPFLDRNLRPGREGEVNCARRCRDVERDAVLPGNDRLSVRANLVCRVSVRSDAIRADQDEVDFSPAEEVTGRSIGDDRMVDSFLQEFPRREPRAL